MPQLNQQKNSQNKNSREGRSPEITK